MAGGSGAANAAGAAMKAAEKNSAFTAPGYHDPEERLDDMDTDGVDVEVIYCEVSAFRYLPDMHEGAGESVRAFNDVLHEFALGRPEAADRLVPDPDPRHRRRGRRGASASPASGAKSLQLPVFPSEFGLPDYCRRALRPAVRAHRGDRACRSAATSA